MTAYLLINQWNNWYIIIVVFVMHFIIDVLKTFVKQNIWTFIFDQLLHFISLCLISLYITNNFSLKSCFAFLYSDRNLIILFSYLIVTLPAGIFISKVLDIFDKYISLESLPFSGLLIGIIERILILSLVLLNQYEAIGFLIASKSFWFSSKFEFGKKERDYILIGNLMSFAIAIIVGAITIIILKYFYVK